MSRSIIVLLVRNGTSSIPGIGGTVARPPTFRKIRSAVRVSSPTCTVFGPVSRAWPWITVPFSRPRIQLSTPTRDWPETPSLRALTCFMSTVAGPGRITPNSAARWAIRAA